MNGDDQEKRDLGESISGAAVEANSSLPQEAGPATPDGPPKKRRKKYNGNKPLDFPAHEAIAQFFAAPKQFRRFESCAALAKHFHVSRMTVYRWARDRDVVKRIEWLSLRNMVFGDFIACREWPAIVKAQIAAALAGDTRAAIFCQKRAWPEGWDSGTMSLVASIEGAINFETSLEADENSDAAELESANENPDGVENKNPRE